MAKAAPAKPQKPPAKAKTPAAGTSTPAAAPKWRKAAQTPEEVAAQVDASLAAKLGKAGEAKERKKAAKSHNDSTPATKSVGKRGKTPDNVKSKPQKPDPQPVGRVSTFTQAIADEICEHLSAGEPLAVICRSEAMPAVRTVSDWKAAHPEFAANFARAREEGFDYLAADTLSIIDTVPERCATQDGDKVDTGHVAWLKNRAEQRLKLLAKWDPKRYGDKIDLNHGGQEGNPVDVRTRVVLVPRKQVAEVIQRAYKAEGD